jgi:PPOX class F420-dependent enzyme/OxyR family protein
MELDDVYVRFLTSHDQGRLATVGPDGSPQNKPVGYRYNPQTGTIDIGGYEMERSAKYRNVGREPRVAFVVDDAQGAGEGAAGMRFLEVRGHAEQAATESEPSRPIIRIHPRRLVSWNVDPNRAGPQSVTLESGTGPGRSDQPARAAGRPALDLGDGASVEAGEAAAALAAELQAGWDTADPDVSNRHFAADIMWGSPFGATVAGYEELHAIHVRLKKQGRGGAASRFEVVRALAPAPGVAVAQIRRTALGDDGRPAGPTDNLTTGAFSEMALYVLIRRGDTWWLAAGQNTPILPPPPG